MPIDPQWITTGTARSEFRSRSTELMGMCLVKRQLRPGDGPLIGKNTQVLQYVASPLILGLCDPPPRRSRTHEPDALGDAELG
ncbi:hypothetical protein [Nocardia fluminea]|uniref:hypothetical protein n=1 Tax=Nocardia fluminea TaxID=134984 RepID=UPI0036530EE7